MKIDSRILWLLLALILFVFGNSWEPGVGVDTATYGAVARDILTHGNWFRPKLAAQIFDPFVEHPYLVIWLQAISLKVWGPTALGINFTSSVLGIAGVIAFFAAIRRLIDENAAVLSAIALLTINVFMNFMSSGWLDMPMVAFVLIAFYFSTRISEEDGFLFVLLTGLFLSFAVLTKGVAALGIFPVMVFAGTQANWKVKPIAIFSLGFFLPLIAFTWAHYQSEGFLFWRKYYISQFVFHNGEDAKTDAVGWSWYIRDALTHAHLVALLFIPGIVYLWKKGHRWIAVTAALEILVHVGAYAFSERHNRQYLLPIFPWLALGAGFLISVFWKINSERWSQGLFYLALTYFVAVSVLPVTVHTMSGAEIYDLLPVVRNSPIQDIYFEVTETERQRGNMTSPYIAWYLQRNPVTFTASELPFISARLKDTEAILLARGSNYDSYLKNQDTVCGWNDAWILISTKENCATLDRKRTSANGYWRTKAAKPNSKVAGP